MWKVIGPNQGKEGGAYYSFEQGGSNIWSIWNKNNQTWEKVSSNVMSVGSSHHIRNGPMCKDKWGSIFKKFKKRIAYTC